MNPKHAFLSVLSRLLIQTPARGNELVLQGYARPLARASSGTCNRRSGEIWALANSGDFALALVQGVPEEFELANISELGGDGWALIARYGDIAHAGPLGRNLPVVQRFDRATAEALVANFKRGAGRIARAVVGIPLYNGHPDAAGAEHLFTDRTVYGTFAAIEARDDGLYGKPVVTTPGSRLIEDGHDRLSPFWDCTKVGETPGGKPIVAPFRLKSVGLVTRSSIPNPSLLNSPQPLPMKTTLQKLLAALGYSVGNDATDEQLVTLANSAAAECTIDPAQEAALSVFKKTAPTLPKQRGVLLIELGNAATAKAAFDADKVTLANAASTAEAAKTKLETENATLKTQVAAVRREASMFLANCAVEDGRLPGAERDTMVTSLCNAADFAAEIGRLSARPRTLKTTSATDELAKKKGQGGSAAGQIIELVNARMDSAKEDYPTAFAHVQTDPEHAALFAGLKTPALKLPAKR